MFSPFGNKLCTWRNHQIADFRRLIDESAIDNKIELWRGNKQEYNSKKKLQATILVWLFQNQWTVQMHTVADIRKCEKSDNGMIFRNSIVLCAINNIFKPTYSKKKQLQYQYTISQLIHNLKNVDS